MILNLFFKLIFVVAGTEVRCVELRANNTRVEYNPLSSTSQHQYKPTQFSSSTSPLYKQQTSPRMKPTDKHYQHLVNSDIPPHHKSPISPHDKPYQHHSTTSDAQFQGRHAPHYVKVRFENLQNSFPIFVW